VHARRGVYATILPRQPIIHALRFEGCTVRKQSTHEFPRGLLAAMLLFSAATLTQNAETELKPVQHEFVIKNFKIRSRCQAPRKAWPRTRRSWRRSRA
jgi:hypothetical protein